MANVKGQAKRKTHDRKEMLFKWGLSYYVAARFGAKEGLLATGNLYHHAIEMLLKAELSRHYSDDDLKNKFAHHLRRIWKEFKSKFSHENLSGFDEIIRKLDRFEEIRYPDRVSKFGMDMTINWDDSVPTGTMKKAAQSTRKYTLTVVNIDRLIARLFELCSYNPKFFLGSIKPLSISILKDGNPVCQDWFLRKGSL